MSSSAFCPYLLLVDRTGWQTFKPSELKANTEYLRLHSSLPDVAICRGTLVEVDPLCAPFDPRTHNSVNVVSLDNSSFKMSVMMRELRPLQPREFDILLPMTPQDRLELLMEQGRSAILDCKVGDTVWYYRSAKVASVAAKSRSNGIYGRGQVRNGSAEKDVGFVRYVGPLERCQDGIFFGIELFLDPNRGDCDGTYKGQTYFAAPPYSSVFTTANHLFPYNEDEDVEQVRQKIGDLKLGLEQHLSTTKKNSWKKFEQDRIDNMRQERVFTNRNYGDNNNATPSSYDRASYVEHLLSGGSRRPSDLPSTSPSQKSTVDTLELELSTPGQSSSTPSFEDEENPPLKNGDRVVWLSDNGPEYGNVKWLGKLPKDPLQAWVAGVEFDNPVGSGNGRSDNQQLFTAKTGHASFVPLDGLLRAADFEESPAAVRRKHDRRPLVDELDLKRRSNSQQQNLAEYKMRQQQVPRKGSSSSSRAEIESASSPSFPGSVENEVNWSSNSNTSRRLMPFITGSNNSSAATPSSYEEDHVVKNRINLRGEQVVQVHHPTANGPSRDPYASEDFVVEAEVHDGQRHQDSSSTNQLSSENEEPFSPASNRRRKSDEEEEELVESPPEFEKLHEDNKSQLQELGTLVQLQLLGGKQQLLYGVIKWTGYLPGTQHDEKMAGIELEEELLGATNGWHNGSQMFACPDRKAVFVPLTHFARDRRFESARNSTVFPDHNGGSLLPCATNGDFGDVECPIVPGFHGPIRPDDVVQFSGRNRGVQGHQNSCYLDATLFAMFSFTSVFDCLLYRPQNPQDINEYNEVQRVLREEIVNPLRKNWFVRADRVMKLRQLLDSLTSVKGLMSEEKDPEELLNSLLSQTLKAAPFLELSSGQTAHLYQLFVERDESKSLPSVQELFEQSFLTSGIKLKRVPSVLILQMPRFGRQFKVYDRILPSQLLDVTDVIEDAPRQCIVCGKLASYECPECFGDHGSGLDSTSFCDTCLNRVHNHHKRRNHKTSRLQVPQEYLTQRFRSSESSSTRLFMELFAVVCIETSHYVSFVKCGLGPDAPWCFFDSMADRKGEQHGYNIPEVTPAPNVSRWLTEEGVSLLNSCRDDKMLPDHAKRLICDGYMCFYQSPDVMMYQ